MCGYEGEASRREFFFSEPWEVEENPSHKLKIEKMLEKKGIYYISTNRPHLKRGGGAGIATDLKFFTMSKCNVNIPSGIETVWGILRPKYPSKEFNQIICCAFYSPPQCGQNKPLLDHLTVTLQGLLSKYPRSAVLISGDRNSIMISDLLTIDASLKQLVRKPTRKNKILDIILTNIPEFYSEPDIIPAIQPDIVGKGVPSDHHVLINSKLLAPKDLLTLDMCLI